MHLAVLSWLSFVVTSAALTTHFNASRSSSLRKRLPGDRFVFPDDSCSPEQQGIIIKKSADTYLLALAGYTGAAAQRDDKGTGIAIAQRVFSPFFPTFPLFDEHVESLMALIVKATKPPPGPNFTTNLICVPPSDEICQDPDTYAYTFKGLGTEAEEAAAQFKDAIYLCDETVTEPFRSRPMAAQCVPGLGDDVLSHNLATVLLQQMFYLSASRGEIQVWETGSTNSQKLKEENVKDLYRSLHNADSFVFYAYAAWKARWFLNPMQYANNIIACLRRVFPNDDIPIGAIPGMLPPDIAPHGVVGVD